MLDHLLQGVVVDANLSAAFFVLEVGLDADVLTHPEVRSYQEHVHCPMAWKRVAVTAKTLASELIDLGKDLRLIKDPVLELVDRFLAAAGLKLRLRGAERNMGKRISHAKVSAAADVFVFLFAAAIHDTCAKQLKILHGVPSMR
jgi:hypothetical protein